MQEISNQCGNEPPLTVRQVADLLCISREAVAKRREADLPLASTSRPAQITAAVAYEAFQVRLAASESTREQLINAYQHQFPHIPLPTQAPFEATAGGPGEIPNQLQRRIDDLIAQREQERIGRAVAEARIEELKTNLRRARAAITALNPDPDMDPDRPEQQGAAPSRRGDTQP